MTSHIGQHDVRRGQQSVEHFTHHGQNQRGQQDLELVALELAADAGADLRSDGGADEQEERQHEVHRVVLAGLHDGDVDAGEKNLEKAGAHR